MAELVILPHLLSQRGARGVGRDGGKCPCGSVSGGVRLVLVTSRVRWWSVGFKENDNRKCRSQHKHKLPLDRNASDAEIL